MEQTDLFNESIERRIAQRNLRLNAAIIGVEHVAMARRCAS